MESLKQLRLRMTRENVDIVIIPSGDYHQSEYSSDYFRLVRFFSNFTGSAGTLVITKEEAVLFTDGRYFIQAEKELDEYYFKLFKMGEEGVPTVIEYVASKANESSVIGFDGKVVSASFGEELKDKLPKGAKINYGFDATSNIWRDRPGLPKDKVWILEEKYSGEGYQSKLKRLREKIASDIDCHIISNLEDIAWLLNLRGNDILYTPIFLSYLLVNQTKVILYIDKDKISRKVDAYLQENLVEVRDYYEFYDMLDSIEGKRVLLDKKRVNCYIYESLKEKNECVYLDNPTQALKSVKNEVEIENLRQAHIKDGIAVTRFILWLKEAVKTEKLTEYDASEYLHKLRKMGEGFIEESFATISAYGANAAMMHYCCDKENASELKPKGMLLVDSGGQYYEGTTDVTRTIALGETTKEERVNFTLVLKGMLNLSHARFLYGCRGVNLDILARGALWERGIDYRCGTGHGISYLMGVHEGPNAIRWRYDQSREGNWVFEKGMVTSNEPGVYVEGKYGIRTENEILCVEKDKNEYGTFLGFETLTCVPIDTDLIEISELNEIEIQRLNQYNKWVMDTLLPYFDKKEQNILRKNVKMLH